MTYEEAQEMKKGLNERVDELSKMLNSYEKNEMGLVPYEVTQTKEYQEIQNSFNSAFAELRRFNSYFVKTFRKRKR